MEKNIKFYTTHCPQCKGVKMLLDSKKIDYQEIVGEQAIIDLGFSRAPILVVDDVAYTGKEIYNWVNTYTRGENNG